MPRLRGAAHEIRFADDAVLCFQYKEDAERVMEVLPKRFAKYGLTIHPEKTRLLEFGRYAEEKAKRQGKKPATFDFLGYTHVCARSRKGKFTVHVRTMKKRFRRGLTAIAEWCQENRHLPVDEQQKALNAKLRGHYQYYGATDELPESMAVSSGGPAHLAQVAEPPHSWKRDDLGAICSHPTEASLVTAAYPTFLAWCGESRLRNPLR